MPPDPPDRPFPGARPRPDPARQPATDPPDPGARPRPDQTPPGRSLAARLIHVVGRQNHGKTTLLLELLPRLQARGLRVGTVKHTGHTHELDTPGKDSHRHRLAGASPVAVVTGELTAVYLPGLDPERPYDTLAPLFAACDAVLVEGHVDGPGPKLEVWRADVGTPPLALERADVHALVTDDPAPAGLTVPVWPRADLDGLVAGLLAHPLFAPRLGLPHSDA